MAGQEAEGTEDGSEGGQNGGESENLDYSQYDVPKDLTGFQRDVLTVLAAEQDPKGLRAAEVMEELYREEINHGRLYPNLDELDNKGLINKQKEDNRTNRYVITPRGVYVLQAYKEFLDDTVPES